jgi:hypothetical protein
MTNSTNARVTPKLARLTGLVYLLIAVIGGSAYFLMSQSLIVPGDAALTASNIQSNLPLLRVGIVAYLAILALDILMAWMLFLLLAPAHRTVSVLAAWLRITYVLIHGAAILNLVAVLNIVNGGLSSLPPEFRSDMILHYGEAHLDGFMVSLVFFGLHLLAVSYLIFKSGYLPKLLGLLLVPAALAYILDTMAMLLLPDYAQLQPQIEPFVAVSAMVGEIGLLLWLLIKGIDPSKQPLAHG